MMDACGNKDSLPILLPFIILLWSALHALLVEGLATRLGVKGQVREGGWFVGTVKFKEDEGGSLAAWTVLCDIWRTPINAYAASFSELEWMLSEKGAVKTSLEEDPRKKRQVRDVMSEAVKWSYRDAEDSDDKWLTLIQSLEDFYSANHFS